MRAIGRVARLLVPTLVAVGCAEGPRAAFAPIGTWESAEVVLDRGDFTETYRFIVTIGEEGEGAFTGTMDIAYRVTGEPSSERLLRQYLAVTLDGNRIVLAGADPRLVSGPDIVGVYEPDVLHCERPGDADADVLECGWGSDAHDGGPLVRLVRRGGPSRLGQGPSADGAE